MSDCTKCPSFNKCHNPADDKFSLDIKIKKLRVSRKEGISKRTIATNIAALLSAKAY